MFGFRIYYRSYAFGESRQIIMFFGLEDILGDVLFVHRAKILSVAKFSNQVISGGRSSELCSAMFLALSQAAEISLVVNW